MIVVYEEGFQIPEPFIFMFPKYSVRLGLTSLYCLLQAWTLAATRAATTTLSATTCWVYRSVSVTVVTGDQDWSARKVRDSAQRAPQRPIGHGTLVASSGTALLNKVTSL